MVKIKVNSLPLVDRLKYIFARLRRTRCRELWRWYSQKIDQNLLSSEVIMDW